MRTHTLADEDYAAAADAVGVCVRPVLTRVTDTETGSTRIVPIACGATREAVCRACAAKARRVRMQQCREGWHRTDEPDTSEPDPQDLDDEIVDAEPEEESPSRRVRSTRRRQDVPDLPRVPMSSRTVGTTFTAPDGKTYQPSMFLTLTLPSYGPVRGDGTPLDPARYDYRRAALDALHVGKLIDRFWQNTRRCAGYHVQYFASIEPQRRLAPHMHAAIRGVLPRAVVREIVAATYVQVWWPHIDEIIYPADDPQPEFDDYTARYVDPTTGTLLPTWDDALDRIDNDPTSTPMHVVRFGTQLDMQGIIAGTPDADRSIRYLTKYLAKSMNGDMNAAGATDRQHAHAERLTAELRWLPCSPKCANWLRYGVQPKDPTPGLVAGHCPNKAHDAEHLGYGGRRVLVSRKWSGKTLTEHRADRAAVVRAVLDAAGIQTDDHGKYSATTDDGPSRFVWERIDPREADAPTYARAIADSIRRAQRWRAEYDLAKQRAGPNPSIQHSQAQIA